MIEVGFVPKRRVASQYPGLFIFTTPARMMRPVHNLVFDKLEMIGTFEQVYMEICITQAEEIKGVSEKGIYIAKVIFSPDSGLSSKYSQVQI